jgi:hypothetical protein
MAPLTANQVCDLVQVAQVNYRRIDHEDWDGRRYRSSDTAKWQQASHEAVPPEHQEWREMVRVLAQGESYYGRAY